MTFLWLLSCFILLGVSVGHGEPASLLELSIRPKIINGKEARPGAWPWHVLLLNGTRFLICGGSLISSNWVITAAHCNIMTSSWALVGLHDTQSPGDFQIRRIAQVFNPPKLNLSALYNDITLLKLNSAVHFNSKVSPILLPLVDDQFLPWSLCKIMGFGSIDSDGTVYPNKLQEATVTIINNNNCKGYWRYYSLDVMFCAQRRGASPTLGDYGGSLVCPKNGVWTLAGIISFSHLRDFINRPFVVTRISAFIPWIEQILAHNSP